MELAGGAALLTHTFSSLLERGCGGGNCAGPGCSPWGLVQEWGQEAPGGPSFATPSCLIPTGFRQWFPLERPVLKEGPPEETPCLSASPDKMWRQKGP